MTNLAFSPGARDAVVRARADFRPRRLSTAAPAGAHATHRTAHTSQHRRAATPASAEPLTPASPSERRCAVSVVGNELGGRRSGRHELPGAPRLGQQHLHGCSRATSLGSERNPRWDRLTTASRPTLRAARGRRSRSSTAARGRSPRSTAKAPDRAGRARNPARANPAPAKVAPAKVAPVLAAPVQAAPVRGAVAAAALNRAPAAPALGRGAPGRNRNRVPAQAAPARKRNRNWALPGAARKGTDPAA